MKRIVYIVALSIGVGLPQCVSAFSTCCYEKQRENGVVRMARGSEAVYEITSPSRITRVRNSKGFYTGSSSTRRFLSLFACTHQVLSQELAQAMFVVLDEKFRGMPHDQVKRLGSLRFHDISGSNFYYDIKG